MNVKAKKKHLLLVDDDLIARLGLRSGLEKAGFSVDEAENGKVAIEKYAAKQISYDLILMDYNMPDMDGATVTKELRHLEGGARNTLIIGVTAHIDPKVKAMCIKSGMDTVISKPIDMRKLNRLIKDFKNMAKAIE